jgi:hypothetical protein
VVYSEGGGGVVKSKGLRGGWGVFDITRKRHDIGRTMLGNHQLRPPPPSAKGRMSGGMIWALCRRSKCIDLGRPDPRAA